MKSISVSNADKAFNIHIKAENPNRYFYRQQIESQISCKIQNKHIIYFNPLISIINNGLVANYGSWLLQSPHLKKFGPSNSSYLKGNNVQQKYNFNSLQNRT